MVLSRLLVFSLLVSASVPSATAQFSSAATPTANPFSSFGTQVAKPTQMPNFGVPSSPSQLNLSASRLNLSPKTLEAIREGNGIGKMQMVGPGVPSRAVAALPEPKACYAMRTYDFSREDSGSDKTRFTGSSTCQSAASVQFKAVGDPREVLPR
jgi:hypothetical protein